MNPRILLTLFILIAVLAAFSGCTGSSGSPAATIPTPETITPATTAPPALVTRLPAAEIARLTLDHFGLNPSTESIYEFIGKVQVDNGPYQSVKVLLRYPDGQEYVYDAGGMGGSNQTRKPFYLYPDNRYVGMNPEKIIELDGKRYATTYRYENGVLSWVAMRADLIRQ